ncbi:short chain dehydrogenase [Paraphaeosphaeria sporulosa]
MRYAATHLTHMLATTFAQTKVRVNGIAPGVFPSESNLKTEMSNPAGRPNSDIDVAASIVFLAGPGGVFYNEQILFPDGERYLLPAAQYSSDKCR